MTTSEFNVSSASQISSIFKSLARNRALLTAEFGRNDVQAATLILDVDAKNGTCVIDPFTDPNAQRAVAAKQQFALRGSNGGVQLYCPRLSLQGQRAVDGSTGLEINLPERMHYLQRRDFFRLDVERIMTLNATLKLTPGQRQAMVSEDPDAPEPPTELQGDVVDLSGGGMGLVFYSQVMPVPRPDDNDIVDVTLSLHEDADAMTLPAQWRFSNHSASRETLQVGLEFIEPDRTQQDRIQQFVVKMQFVQRRIA
ncbi:MAG: flagellar regulator YcgR PilZN domain-containing protein [Pseudomonadota bacterium]